MRNRMRIVPCFTQVRREVYVSASPCYRFLLSLHVIASCYRFLLSLHVIERRNLLFPCSLIYYSLLVILFLAFVLAFVVGVCCLLSCFPGAGGDASASLHVRHAVGGEAEWVKWLDLSVEFRFIVFFSAGFLSAFASLGVVVVSFLFFCRIFVRCCFCPLDFCVLFCLLDFFR